MNRRYLTLISRIENELEDLNKIVQRTYKAWDRAQSSTDDLYLDSVSLNLHGFYASLERIFELIASEIDGIKLEGSSWHRDLLKEMGIKIKSLRPPVLSKNTINKLDEYRGFRHVVRNVYTFNISERKLEPLVNNLEDIFKNIENELNEFIDFLMKNG